MILLDLKHYIEAHKRVDLIDLARHFKMPANVIEEMLERWVQKGVIEKEVIECGGCHKCTGPKPTFYRYCEAHSL